jgi:hypothetical protein
MKYVYSYNVYKNGYFYKTVYTKAEAQKLVVKLEKQKHTAYFSYIVAEVKQCWTKIQLER